jgi:hypothetical protein
MDKYTFRFEFLGNDTHQAHQFVVDDGEQHSEIHRRFVDFLSAVYGYDLRKEYLGEDSIT